MSKKMMKAWTLYNIAEFKYEDVSIPTPRDGEVLVKVKAAGICGSDVPRIYRDGAHSMPLIPGHEFSGEVIQIGRWVDESWLHKRVGVYPLIPCHECKSCRAGNFEMCKNYSYLGSRQNGGFAEYVVVPVRNLIELPDCVTYEQAAMLEPMAVAVHAMRQVNLSQTDTVVVYGVGTIGLLLTMFLLEKGITNLFVIGNKKFKEDMIKRMGISEAQYCDSSSTEVMEWVCCHTNGHGADVVFECVGRNETISNAIEVLAPKGTVCMVGNPYSDMILEKTTYWKILRNQLTIVGTWNSSFFPSIHNSDEYGYYDEAVDWEYVLHKLEEKRISPEMLILHRFSFDELEHGLEIMRNKLEEYIKVCIVS